MLEYLQHHFSRRNSNFRRTMSDIPSEIVTEILSFVPAESLLRLRCVSKSWCALIDSPNFIKLHLSKTIETNSDRKVFCLPLKRCYTADFDLMEETNRAEYAEICYPFEKYPETEIAGSCHGLLCLYNYFDEIALWNPTTRRSIELPHSKFELSDKLSHRKIHGFGYDEVTDDYKVVRMWCSTSQCEAKVFSLKSNSWRSITPFPYRMLLGYQDYGVLVGGSLHWIAYTETESKREYFIGAFDLGTEEYRLVPLPDYPCEIFFVHLTVLGESLCAYYTFYDGDHCDFWVMKKYGCKDSWTKLFTYSSSSLFRVTPLAYSRSGRQVLMLEGNEHFWYDLETREIKFSTNDDKSLGLDTSQICFGSLVQLDGGIRLLGTMY